MLNLADTNLTHCALSAILFTGTFPLTDASAYKSRQLVAAFQETIDVSRTPIHSK